MVRRYVFRLFDFSIVRFFEVQTIEKSESAANLIGAAALKGNLRLILKNHFVIYVRTPSPLLNVRTRIQFMYDYTDKKRFSSILNASNSRRFPFQRNEYRIFQVRRVLEYIPPSEREALHLLISKIHLKSF